MAGRQRLTQGERTEASRQTLVDATMRVLAKEGYRNATVARIQDVAGVSRGLVGYHFGSKLGLMEAVITAIRDSYVSQALAGQDDLSGLDAIVLMIDAYLTRLAQNPTPAKVVLVLAMESVGELPEIRDAMRSRLAEMRAEFTDWLQRGIQDKTVRADVDPPATAVYLEGVLRGVTLQFLVDPDGFDLNAARQATITATTRSLGTT